MLGALALRIAQAAPDERNATVMAEAMVEATDASYAAVGTPVEGTILTVARAAAEAAVRRAEDPRARARDVFAAAAAAAREALARTPDQLRQLRDAGVVDAGGRGLSVILDAAETVLTGRRPVARDTRSARRPSRCRSNVDDLTRSGPAYEVMYLLDADDAAVASSGRPRAARRLAGRRRRRGALERPRPRRRRRRRDRGRHRGRPPAPGPGHPLRRAGRGSRQAGRGARGPPDRRRRRRPRARAALRATPARSWSRARPAGARRPGCSSRRSTAPARPRSWCCPTTPTRCGPPRSRPAPPRRTSRVRVAVIPTEAQVQGLAALAVHEPARGFDADVLEMTATARHARHGAVTIAAKQAMTMAGPCEPGDVLGVIAGDFAVVGDDLRTVATEVLERLLGGGGELVTLVGGAATPTVWPSSCEEYVEERHAHVDVVVYDGGQDRYPLLMSVE